MQDLKVIGVESDSLLLLAASGERFRLPLSALARSGLRSAPKPSAPATPRTVSPKDIQAQIRSGLSAEQVAASTGSELEYVRRFEGPVMAEREHIVKTAQAVPVHSPWDSDALDGQSVFGEVIQRRLLSLGAEQERWDSWKESDTSWTIQLTFTAHTIDHDARWDFEPRKRALQPQNTEATALSQQTDAAFADDGLLPKLRAVAPEAKPDTSRFDSGAFIAAAEQPVDGAARRHPSGLVALPSATSAEEVASGTGGSTSDLLESLRRRRGERQSMPAPEDPRSSDSDISILDIPMHSSAPEAPEAQGAHPTLPTPVPESSTAPHTPGSDPAAAATPDSAAKAQGAKRQQTGSHGRRGRASMPSWDEIVFGTRPEND